MRGVNRQMRPLGARVFLVRLARIERGGSWSEAIITLRCVSYYILNDCSVSYRRLATLQ